MRRVLFSCFCGLLWSSSGWAVDPLGTININLHGNVVDFSCTVNTADKVIILVCLVFGLMRFQKGRA